MSRTVDAFDLETTPIEPGVTLIEASAGTGKTYSLTGLVLRLLLEGHVPDVGSILVMTFTKAATAELVNRIRAAVRSAIAVFAGDVAEDDADSFYRSLRNRHGSEGLAVLQRALRDLDDLQVSTIHGFCRRMLDQNAFETGMPFDVEYGEDDGPMLKAAAEDFWRRVVYPAGDLLGAIVDAKQWNPTTFLADYRTARRHPSVEISPSPLPLDEALAAVDARARKVREAWDRGDLGKILAPGAFGKNKMPAATLQMRLAGVDAFCNAGRADAIVDILALRPNGSDEKKLLTAPKKEYAQTPFRAAVGELDAAVTVLEHALRGAFLRDLDSLMEDAKRTAGTAHYDDLLHRLRNALRDGSRAGALREAARSQFRAVLVDEFQDTDEIQYEIFRDLFSDSLLFFVGDPKQAIYGFRGADVFAYLRAKKDADREHTLGCNYRSETPLVEAVNEVFSAQASPFVLEGIRFQRAEPAGRADHEPLEDDSRRALEWLRLPLASNQDEATADVIASVVAEIARLIAPDSPARLGGERVQPRHIAILVRRNQAGVEAQTALARAGIPAVVSQAGNVFQSDEAAELAALLAAVDSPRHGGAVRAALATRTFGYDARRIGELGADSNDWDRLVEELQRLREVWAGRGFVKMAEELLALAEAREHLLAGRGGTRRLTNLLHLIELFEHASEEHHLSPDGAIAWLSQMRANPELHAADAAEIRLESDEAAVQITTVHKSKGLEYDIVFCPFLWKGRDPEKDSRQLVHLEGGRVVCHYPALAEDGEISDAHAKERLADEIREAYVALTRAKHRCYVVWGSGREKDTRHSALAHLLAGGDVEAASAALDDLCAANPGLMAASDVELGGETPRWELPVTPGPTLSARRFPDDAVSRLRPWRVASFSSFRAIGEAAVELPDHRDPRNEPSRVQTPPRGIFAFASGARAGTCLHEIFELCDFQRVGDAGSAALVADKLSRHGLDHPSVHGGDIDPAATVATLLADVVGSRLPHAAFRLRDVELTSRLPEWQFHLPAEAVSARRFAAVFARHGEGLVREQYAPHLERLGGDEIEGFLMGFVDLVFEHEGRWYLVDWKSNHLGNDVADYGDEAIFRAMRDHHYVLQYHLYALALHRYLAQRLRDYSYDRHFGGVYYAFLRGIRRDREGGWYFDKPPRALIEGLDSAVRPRSEP